MIRRKTPLARGAPPKRGGRPKAVNKKRSAGEFSRIYGSKARVRWVKASPCVCCDAETGRNHNHHTENGGMGRKADYDTIVSLCPTCHTEHHSGVFKGSKEWWASKAAETERQWREVAESE